MQYVQVDANEEQSPLQKAFLLLREASLADDISEISTKLVVLRQELKKHRNTISATENIYDDIQRETPYLSNKLDKQQNMFKNIEDLITKVLRENIEVNQILSKISSLESLLHQAVELEEDIIFEHLNEPPAID